VIAADGKTLFINILCM